MCRYSNPRLWPRAKRSRSITRAGLVGYRFETAYNAIAPMWQSGAYIRSCELNSFVEGANSNNVARKTKGWSEPWGAARCHTATASST
jgi:hypothetical protein